MKVVVAGAAGFVGRELCRTLSPDHQVTALTRQVVSDAAQGQHEPQWRQTNLFSLLDVERALAGADVGVYLVHSMSPPSSLTQGAFEDLDLILADNFARAAKLHGLKRIVYLGGLIPPGTLSLHLESRLEVEKVLASHGVPVVSLRAGLVIGRDGSSFRILQKLVERLPAMVCPQWTTTRCQPIALQDVIDVFVRAINDPELKPGPYDIGGPDTLTYVDMMRQVAAAMNKRRLFLNVPFVSPALSRLWVSTVTHTPKALVYPLIQSLQHDMVTRDTRLQAAYGLKPIGFLDAVQQALEPAGASLPDAAPRSSLVPQHLRAQRHDPTVTSVQRLPLPAGHSLSWIVSEYARWVPRMMPPIIHVDATEDGSLSFCFRPFGLRRLTVSLLELSYSRERSSLTRQLYYLTGGALLRKKPGTAKGRLEFRCIPGKAEVMAAVLDFRPRLPWWLYKLSQAKVHLWIMRFFGRHLQSMPAVNLAKEIPSCV